MTPEELVQREVIYCVSCLISDLGSVAEQLDDYDTYLTLVGGKPDYEEAARYFILNDADLSELEEIVDEYSWCNVIEVVTDPSYDLLRPYIVEYNDDRTVLENHIRPATHEWSEYVELTRNVYGKTS